MNKILKSFFFLRLYYVGVNLLRTKNKELKYTKFIVQSRIYSYIFRQIIIL